mmetsp:Transcript_100777/g.262702  ORF Transcript_100777/g.262702 Transcript_100777/m.262702 type:complete len:239 (+) Transcript_100777:567-1283(+)
MQLLPGSSRHARVRMEQPALTRITWPPETFLGSDHWLVWLEQNAVIAASGHDTGSVQEVDAVHGAHHCTRQRRHYGLPVGVHLGTLGLAPLLEVRARVETVLEGQYPKGPVEEGRAAHRPLVVAVEVVARGARVRDGRVGGARQHIAGVRHAVLHGAVAASRARGHACEPKVAHGNVGLERVGLVVLRAHPVLLVHLEAPALLLREEPLEEGKGVLRNRYPVRRVPLEAQIVDVVRVR